jgi:hypothetical protein
VGLVRLDWVFGMDGRAGLDTDIGVAKLDIMYLREDASVWSRPLAKWKLVKHVYMNNVSNQGHEDT